MKKTYLINLGIFFGLTLGLVATAQTDAFKLLKNKNTSIGNTTLSVTPSTGIIPGNNSSIISFTVTNTGTDNTATNVSASLPPAWTAVLQDASGCTAIAPNGGTCQLNFSSTLPYVAEGNILITGDNISSPPSISLAFSLPDPNGNYWMVVSVDSANSATVTDNIFAVNIQWGNNVITGATDLYNGYSNTNIIVNTPNIGSSAAVSCYNSTEGGATVGTWYLPAICQLGGVGLEAGCSTTATLNNLVQLGFGSFNTTFAWSSTECLNFPQYCSWLEFFAYNAPGTRNYQTGNFKNDSGNVLVICFQSVNY